MVSRRAGGILLSRAGIEAVRGMGQRVFDARSAPEEEVEGVRRALREAGIGFYETSAGKWMIGNAALWVKDNADADRARVVVREFQKQWLQQARAEPAPARINWPMVPVLIAVVILLAWLSFSLFSL